MIWAICAVLLVGYLLISAIFKCGRDGEIEKNNKEVSRRFKAVDRLMRIRFRKKGGIWRL